MDSGFWNYVHGQIEAMEVLLAGALRREKSFEAATKQMASEVKQLNSLVCTSCSKRFSSYVMEETDKEESNVSYSGTQQEKLSKSDSRISGSELYSCSDAPHFLSVCPFEGSYISGLTCRCNNVSKTRKVGK